MGWGLESVPFLDQWKHHIDLQVNQRSLWSKCQDRSGKRSSQKRCNHGRLCTLGDDTVPEYCSEMGEEGRHPQNPPKPQGGLAE